MTGPVVVGIDDFEHCDRLVALAAREAQLRGVPLWLAHACHGSASERLATVADQVTAEVPGLSVTATAVAGPAASALAEIASSASLLVVGRGHRGLTGQSHGSAPWSVLRHAGCPVLVMGGTGETAEHRVLIGIDLDPPATGPDVLEFAFAEADLRHADLYAVHVWEDPSIPYARSNRADAIERRKKVLQRRQERLDKVLAPWQETYPDVKVLSEALAGLPAKVLTEATATAGLAVVGGQARERQTGMRIGGIAHVVVRDAHCAVAIVPEH